MLRIIKRRTGAAYSCHSTRVGAAQDARAMGETTGAIQQAGGRKSEMMVARYTARHATRDGAAARVAKAQGAEPRSVKRRQQAERRNRSHMS